MTLTKDDLAAIGALLSENNAALEQIIDAKIDEALAPIRTDIHYMKNDIEILKKDVSEIKFDVAALRHEIATVKIDVASLQQWRASVQIQRVH